MLSASVAKPVEIPFFFSPREMIKERNMNERTTHQSRSKVGNPQSTLIHRGHLTHLIRFNSFDSCFCVKKNSFKLKSKDALRCCLFVVVFFEKFRFFWKQSRVSQHWASNSGYLRSAPEDRDVRTGRQTGVEDTEPGRRCFFLHQHHCC